MVTMQDVAVRAGVSLKTVSNVVNDFPSIRPSTRARVQQALVELGYRPNMAARSLARGRTGMIALLFPDLERGYFGRLGASLIRRAQTAGLVAVIHPSGETTTGELAALDALQKQWVDGVIATSFALTDADLVSRLGPLPAVMLGERWGGERLLDHVSIDLRGAGRLAIVHLLDQGWHRIGLIGRRRTDFGRTGERLHGAIEALTEAGLTPVIAEVGHYDRRQGYTAMQAMLDETAAEARPEAVFCFNDELAIGALAALHDAGLRCPDDMALMGCDDIADARYAVPAISTIRHCPDDLAAALIGRLQRAIERRDEPGPAEEPQDLTVGFELVVRGSTVAGAPQLARG